MNDFSLHPQLAKDTFLITELPLCSVLLMNEQQFPWVILVPRIHNISEIFELNEEQRKHLESESFGVSSKMMTHFKGFKMNTAALGNIVPQLHIHHIVRYKHDAAWPAPVWGNVPSKAYSDFQRDNLLIELRTLFDEISM